MKKVVLGIAAAAFLTLSCSNGSATSLETSEKGSSDVVTASAKSSGDNQIKGVGKPVHLTKQDFLEKVMNYEKNQSEWVYEGDLPALIDFYADWCGPCRTAAPILEEISKEYAGKVTIYKIDTQVEQELAAVFGISGIPAFLYIPVDGKPSMTSGIGRTKEDTKKMFQENIKNILLVPNS